MSNLEKYVKHFEEFKSNNPNITEVELIRYIYLDLGNRFSFNLDFSFGNAKIKKEIYGKCISARQLNECMENNVIICKSMCYIIEYILKKLGIDAITVYDTLEVKYPHTYNIIRPKNGENYSIDLQADMYNIQSHSATENFGLAIDENKPPVISRFDLEKIDKKIGYISSENYYADEYIYLMKSDIGYFEELSEKAQFVLENLEINENPNMKYAERKWYHEKILKKLFSKKELQKIHFIDCYIDEKGERQYKKCICVEGKNDMNIYMFSSNDNKYCKIPINDFSAEIKNKLKILQKIPRLANLLKKSEKEENIRT